MLNLHHETTNANEKSAEKKKKKDTRKRAFASIQRNHTILGRGKGTVVVARLSK